MTFKEFTSVDGTKTYVIIPEIDSEKFIIRTINDCVRSVDTTKVLTNYIEMVDPNNPEIKGFGIIVKP